MNNSNIKRHGDYFSIATKPESQRLGIELCDKCAISDKCKYRKYLNRQNDVIAPVKQCKAFVPYITFSVLAGLDFDSFNTFRPYEAWANRLQVGDIVCLYNSVESEIIAMRTVKAIYQGCKREMLETHAHHNHAVLAAQADNPLDYLKDILVKSMGKNFYNAATTASVLYF